MSSLNTSAINNAVYSLKGYLKKSRSILKINARIKARQLKSKLRRLSSYYSRELSRQGKKYRAEEAVLEFQGRLTALRPDFTPKKPGHLRVFWVGANRDQDESGFLQALRRLAIVKEFQNWKGSYGQWYWDDSGRVQVYDPKIVALNDQCLLTQIEEALEDGPIDLLLGQMWANYLSKEALAKVRDYGIPVVNISMDDRLPDNWAAKSGTRLGAIGLAAATDLVLTTSSETRAWYAAEGCPAIFWPLASDPGVFKPDSTLHRDIDVLFIGNKYGVRENIINTLNSHGVHVECYGAGWPNGTATAEQSAALFKRARIVLGVGTVGYCDDVFTLKLRDFDAPMSGALYLTHRNPDLSQLYEEGIEIECYETSEEAAKKISHYLARPDELAAIAGAGHAKALERDTWTNRLQTTFTLLGLMNRTSVPEVPAS